MNKIKDYFKNIDELDLKIMKNGLIFSFVILIFSVMMLAFYLIFNNYLFLYNCGLSLFKIGTYFGVEFVVCGIVVDSIKKGIA